MTRNIATALFCLLPLCGWCAEDSSEVTDYAAIELELAKRPAKSIVDANTLVRLGYELPNTVIIGKGFQPKVIAKGVLAQGAIGEPKRFELRDGGTLGLGSAGFRFDSNYAHGRTNEVVFAGGEVTAFESSFIRSAAPIILSGMTKVVTKGNLILRTSFCGSGSLAKCGGSILGLQYPCPEAKGQLVIQEGTVVLSSAASWGGTVVVKKGAVLKCSSLSSITKLVREPGAKVIETGLSSRGDLSESAFPQPATAYNLAKYPRENIGRGVIAYRLSANTVNISWRYKSSDPANITFNVYRDGHRVNSAPIANVTYFVDRFQWDAKAHIYEVRGLVRGKEIVYSTSGKWKLEAAAEIGSFDIHLTPPASSKTPDGDAYDYYPCDTTIGDLDGDGEYELVIIWWPSISRDNSQGGQTGETWLEGVKLDGTSRSLWKICLGPNIRSGAHYVPILVADFDGDGAAEIICRTADGTVDGRGRILANGVFAKSNNFYDWRKEDPFVVFAPNYVTCFSGKNGAALDTIPYKPSVHEDPKVISKKDYNAVKKLWNARNAGNQAFRFLGAVGSFDGLRVSAVLCRGYYSRTCLTAYDLVNGRLKERWYFCSDDEENWGYGGQGFHNLRVGDIDFDGKDEILYGHMCVDHNGQGLWTTGYGHGDALHLIQSSPETRGLQLWTCHEAKPYGVSLIDAQSGRTLLHKHGPSDTGSCNALDIDPNTPGLELFSGTHCGIFSAKTFESYAQPKPNPAINYYGTLRFGIWWMGDLTRSAYSGGDIIRGYSTKERVVSEQWNGGGATDSNHGTKGTPCLIADLFGDWREELLLRRKDNRAIRVYLTPEPTRYRFHTFLEDPIYRWSVATQMNGYNVPTGTGFYFGPDLLGHKITFRGMNLE